MPRTIETAANEAEIAKIQDTCEAGEQKLVEDKFTRKEVALTGDNIKETIKQKWAKRPRITRRIEARKNSALPSRRHQRKIGRVVLLQ